MIGSRVGGCFSRGIGTGPKPRSRTRHGAARRLPAKTGAPPQRASGLLQQRTVTALEGGACAMIPLRQAEAGLPAQLSRLLWAPQRHNGAGRSTEAHCGSTCAWRVVAYGSVARGRYPSTPRRRAGPQRPAATAPKEADISSRLRGERVPERRSSARPLALNHADAPTSRRREASLGGHVGNTRE